MPDPEAVFAAVRRICLALPGAHEQPFGGHTSPAFRVGAKIFVMVAEDGTHLQCKGAPGAQAVLVGARPDRFYVPPYVGHRGWLGIRLDEQTDWDEVAGLVEESWRMTAPRQLIREYESRGR